jgi:uncharacterized protein (DUF58 family)
MSVANQHVSSPSRIRAWFRTVTTYDVFPEFSAKVRRLFYNPLGVLVLSAIAALLCGIFLHPHGFVLCGGISTVIALGIAWPWLNLRGLQGSITFDRARAREGEQVEVCLILRNRLVWSVWGLAIRSGFIKANDAVVISIASSPGRRTIRCRWSFAPACRGVYPLVDPLLTTGFPFGLWENKKQASVEAALIVWPKTFPVGPVPLVSGDQQVEGNVARNKVGSSGDVLGVRPYRRGDSPRRIHWAQTARHDRLIVCELQANARPVIQLVLDADPRVHTGEGSDSSREWAIRIIASLAKGWLEAGAQVGVACPGFSIRPSSGHQHLLHLLDSLAKLPDATESELVTTLASPICRDLHDGLQVIVTTDAAIAAIGRTCSERQRWVILKSSAFGGPNTPSLDLPFVPWLWIESAQLIPTLLRGGWREARHGS